MSSIALEFDRYPLYAGTVNVTEQIEWIRTSEAAVILGVRSTEGVLVIVRGNDRNNPNWIVRYLNVGTEDKPRFMLAKEDIIELAKKRKP